MQSKSPGTEKHRIETLAVHAGQPPEPHTGAISVPVFMTSTYVQTGPGEHRGYEYSRSQNPTRAALEANLAALEGARHGVCFASGCAAATTVLHMLKTGDHIIAGDDLYGGSFRIFERVMRQFGLDTTYVDPTRTEAFAAAVRPNTRLIWLETPTNPLLKLCDIAAVAEVAKKNDIILCVDNTFLSPVLQRPLELGATMVVHSTTKYLGGHADVIGGAVLLSDDELAEKLRYLQNAIGAVPSPLDCFLVMRGTKTLPLRMQRHGENALALATWLEELSRSGAYGGLIERVVYPGLPSHPQHALATRQMRGPGGMISFFVRDGEKPALERCRAILRKVAVFACAESLGGVESLIEHPAIMTHASVPAEQRRQAGISDGLIRISVGIEHLDDLRADLEQAFASS
jgi:cystathionine gamma-lyase